MYTWTNQNFSTIARAISPHLNAKCLAVLNDLGPQARAQALATWESEINENGYLEIAARYSKTGHPVTIVFNIVNIKEIQEAIEKELDDIPQEIYSY